MILHEHLGAALAEARQNKWYYQRFLADNPVLAPLVVAYIEGTGDRPTEQQLGQNHFARSLVYVEDVRRALAAPVPDYHPLLADYVGVVQVTGEIEPDGRIPTAALRRP